MVNSMNITITGGAGFIGRWVTKKLLNKHDLKLIDNLSNSKLENIAEFINHKSITFIKGDILEEGKLDEAIDNCDLCIHLAAKINVQESLDDPLTHIKNNILGTYKILEKCRKKDISIIIFGTCMVYDLSTDTPISEEHPVLPKSPYAATKLAAEELALSYYYGYGLPMTIVRVFSTYGPFQKSNSEGGVVSIFIRRYLQGEDLLIYGKGNQTRDLLYVEDCADFISKIITNSRMHGEIYNAGSGKDTSINQLAELICKDPSKIKLVEHIHPQSEIMKLVCDYSKAKEELGWMPKTSLQEGIYKTTKWMRSRI